MNKFVCIHSHFYQPPRENPWLDRIEGQASAAPFHDWNERISAECYRENGRSRIINERSYVEGFSNNYSKMSFNMGPTLLSWLEHYDSTTYDYILKGDKISVERFNGHGNAIAQCYNHMIMPLANRRDKETQVVWGIKDFEKRFHRPPEAMWLPETAVDTESLEVLAQYGMKYVILAPRQAHKIRKLGTNDWISVSFEKINTRMAYQIKLPSGATIAAFFYDGSLAKAVAFDGLLHNGDNFAQRILNGFQESGDTSQIVHIATDGESYGHHHKYGDMALSYVLKNIDEREDVTLCNYGYYLELYPPEYEVEIFENSSWSCAHGVERWKSDCGCNSGGWPQWNQKWRMPLRKMLDEIRDDINLKFENLMIKYEVDPWVARNDFINVLFNRSESSNRDFLLKWVPELKDDSEQVKFIKAFEMQRQMLFMYTSCAWFFDELSGIETVQVLQYALRAVELAEDIWGDFIFDKFLSYLKTIPSNLPIYENGFGIYNKILKNSQIGFFELALHYVVESLFKEPSSMTFMYGLDITKGDMERIKLGSNKFVCGHAEIRSRITYSNKQIIFAAVNLGENVLSVGVSILESDDEYLELKKCLIDKVYESDFADVMYEIDKKFEKKVFSLRDILPEDRNLLIKIILTEKMEKISFQYQQIYNDNYPLVSLLNSFRIEMPRELKVSFEHVINEKIIQIFKENIEDLKIRQLQLYIDEANKNNILYKENDMRKVFQSRLVVFADGIRQGQFSQQILENFLFVVKVSKVIFPDMAMSEVQYLIWQLGDKLESISAESLSTVKEIFDELKIEFRMN